MTLLVSNLSKKYANGVSVFSKFCLQVEVGEIVALSGSSGIGKTTLLHCIIGLQNPDEGDVFWKGKSIVKSEPSTRPMGIMMQRQPLYEHLSVEKNISYAVHASEKKSIDDLIRMCQLDTVLRSKVSKLSGGERRRVSFARAVANNPDLLLLDEPFVSLDDACINHLLTAIKSFASQKDKTILIATHRLELAKKLDAKIFHL